MTVYYYLIGFLGYYLIACLFVYLFFRFENQFSDDLSHIYIFSLFWPIIIVISLLVWPQLLAERHNNKEKK